MPVMRERKTAAALLMAGCVLLLSLLAGFNQVKAMGLSWQEEHYLPEMRQSLEFRAERPWQYRPLSHAITAGLCAAGEKAGIPRAAGLVLVAVRAGQNLIVMMLALWYWRRFGISWYAGLLGLSALAWAMTRTNHQANLAFSVYTEIILFLLAALAALARRPLLLIPLVLLAALNRETAALLSFVALAGALSCRDRGERRIVWHAVFAASLMICGFVLLLLHFLFTVEATEPARAIYLAANLDQLRGWGNLAGALGIAPVLALALWRRWPVLLRHLFWCIIPIWFVWHYTFTPLAQPQVLILPLVLVFLPGALTGLDAAAEDTALEGAAA